MRQKTKLLASLVVVSVAIAAAFTYLQFVADKQAVNTSPGVVPPDTGPQTLQRIVRDDGGAELFVHPSGDGWLEIPRTPSLPAPPAANSAPFVGPEACAECHQDKYEGFLKTAHFHTSAPATEAAVKGPVEGESARMRTSNQKLSFEMTRQNEQFQQTVFFWDKQVSFPMDIVTGSGKMGQTYLYWKDELLFQNQVSYFRETHQWINSPGYPEGSASYARPIFPRCLECHLTYAESLPGAPNRFRASSMIFGVTCERCHGEGQSHIEYHRQNPGADRGHAIVNPSRLSRQRSNEVCAQCHSGINPSLSQPFQYRPGEPLGEYFQLQDDSRPVEGGVHTDNQLARLKESACFQSSEMTCATCHDPHQQERGNLPLFSKRCMTCHELPDCGQSSRLDHDKMRNNCIDCHMPQRRDEKTRLQGAQQASFPLLRDHLIRVDAESAAKWMPKFLP